MESLATVERAVDVLFHLLEKTEPTGVSAVANGLGLPKSTVHRLLTTLVKRGLVERNERGRYSLGFGLVSLGLGVLAREPMVALAQPFVRQVAQDLGETAFLVGTHAGRIVVLDKTEGNGMLRATPRIGAQLPAHATAAGKLYLSMAPGAVTVDPELTRFTPRTRTSLSELEPELVAARGRKWAESRDEWMQGLTVISAAIETGNELRGCVSVGVATSRLDDLGLARVVQSALAAADGIASRLALPTA